MALTILSGLSLYWLDLSAFGPAWVHTGPGRTFSAGAAFGILTAIVGGAINMPAAKKLGVLGASIQAGGKPPAPEQAAELAAIAESPVQRGPLDNGARPARGHVHGRRALRPLMLRPSRAAFAFIFITVALDMLALGIIVPVLPKLVVSFEGGDVSHAARIVGLFGFSWAAMQFLALADRRRAVRPISDVDPSCSSPTSGSARLLSSWRSRPSVPWLLRRAHRSRESRRRAIRPRAPYIADVTRADQRAAKFGLARRRLRTRLHHRARRWAAVRRH